MADVGRGGLAGEAGEVGGGEEEARGARAGRTESAGGGESRGADTVEAGGGTEGRGREGGEGGVASIQPSSMVVAAPAVVGGDADDAVGVSIRAGHIVRTVLEGEPPRQSTLAALAFEKLCRPPQMPLEAEAGVVRNEMHVLLAAAAASTIEHDERAPRGGGERGKASQRGEE